MINEDLIIILILYFSAFEHTSTLFNPTFLNDCFVFVLFCFVFCFLILLFRISFYIYIYESVTQQCFFYQQIIIIVSHARFLHYR